MLEEISQLVYDQVSKMDSQSEEADIQAEFSRQMLVKLGPDGNLIARFFQIQDFKVDTN